VVHHPTVIAAHGEGERWTFAGDAEVRSKFWGRSIELIPVGLIRLKFDDGDEYNWTKVTACRLPPSPSTLSPVCYEQPCAMLALPMSCFWLAVNAHGDLVLTRECTQNISLQDPALLV